VRLYRQETNPMLKETLLALYSFLQQSGPAAVTPKPAPAPAQAPTADHVVGKLQEFYSKNGKLTAVFRQEYKNETFGKTTKSDGKVYVKKPGKMRWDYAEKVKGKSRTVKSFISDGVVLWAVENDNKQAFKKDLEKDLLPVAVTFLYGKGDLRKDFDAKFADKKRARKLGQKPGELVLELTPRQPSAQYKTLWLVVSPDDYRVRRSIVLEASGNENAFTFYEPDVATEIDDKKMFTVDEKALAKAQFRIIEPDEEEVEQ
jgi:outer membrane lipoprotein carrier protein